jgi:hypothetical protein
MDDSSRVDPELLRQLDEAGDSDIVVAAVSVERKPGKPPDPAKINADFQKAMARAERMTGAAPRRVQVMPHLAVAYVEAPGRLIRALLDQPEITGAVAGSTGDETPMTSLKAVPDDAKPSQKPDPWKA